MVTFAKTAAIGVSASTAQIQNKVHAYVDASKLESTNGKISVTAGFKPPDTDADMKANSLGTDGIEMPEAGGTHRILNVHRNVPGVIRDITTIISDRGGNIHAQVLATDPDMGYLIVDLDQDVSHDVKDAVSALDTSIRTRIVYA